MDLSTLDPSQKILVVAGCSYSYVYEFMRPALDKNGIFLLNVGEAGRSNKFISQMLIYTLEKLKNHPKENIFVMMMLSSVDRQELTIDRTSNEFHKDLRFENYAGTQFFTGLLGFRLYKWYNHVFHRDDSFDPDRDRGFLATTNIRRNDPDSPINFEKFAGVYHKYFYTKLGTFESTLLSVISLQSYCLLHNIKFQFLTWQDVFYDTSFGIHFLTGQHVIRSGNKLELKVCKYHTLQKRIDMYPELRYLYDQIDFSKWWFNNTERCETGGLADWCIEHSVDYFGTESDTCHPSPKGYTEFADRVLVPLVKQRIGWINN